MPLDPEEALALEERFQALEKANQGFRRRLRQERVDYRLPDSVTNFDLDTALFPPTVRVRNSANQSIDNISWTALSFDTESYNTDNMHPSATHLTARTPGVYRVYGNIRWATDANGTRQHRITVNATTPVAYWYHPHAIAGVRMYPLSTEYALDLGDYFRLEVYQDSGGGLNIEQVSDYTPVFGMTWVAPLPE